MQTSLRATAQASGSKNPGPENRLGHRVTSRMVWSEVVRIKPRSNEVSTMSRFPDSVSTQQSIKNKHLH